MSIFHIKRISLTGYNTKEAIINFGKGLNIIYGPSNTGKSYIVDCIDYMYGSKKESFRIDEDTGYNCVNMLVATEYGEIQLQRYFGDNKINVNSFDYRIKSGYYSTTTGKNHINLFWLTLMGITYPPSIISSATYKRQALTARTLVHTILIGEESVIQNESIMFHHSGYSKTSTLSALLYLMTGNDYSEYEFREDKIIKEARKSEVIKYIYSNLNKLANYKNELRQAQTPSIEAVQQDIIKVVGEIENTEGVLSAAIEKSKNLSKEIFNLNDQLAESNMLHNRYQILKQQYISDIKRMTFIVEGVFQRKGIIDTQRCPFCDGAIQKPEVEFCAEATEAEMKKIVSQLKDLEDAENDIITEIDCIQERSHTIKKERTEIEEVISTEINPKIDRLRQSIEDYRNSIEIHKESTMISRYERNMVTDLKELDKEDESEIVFKPKEYFDSEIMDGVNSILSRTLDSCNFDNYSSSYFDKYTFDIVVNGKKKIKYGKGYRAFLNTVVALTFMEYLAKRGEYSPKLLVIDSPILSLKERGSEKASDGMKKSLFRYFLNNQDLGQMIIIENEIPELDYSHANLIHFTKNTQVGRYGLLHGLTE